MGLRAQYICTPFLTKSQPSSYFTIEKTEIMVRVGMGCVLLVCPVLYYSVVGLLSLLITLRYSCYCAFNHVERDNTASAPA